ncbi:sigma factor [Thiohalophilus sp.]
MGNHREIVVQFLRHRLASEADAEELAQKTFLRLFRCHTVS